MIRTVYKPICGFGNLMGFLIQLCHRPQATGDSYSATRHRRHTVATAQPQAAATARSATRDTQQQRHSHRPQQRHTGRDRGHRATEADWMRSATRHRREQRDKWTTSSAATVPQAATVEHGSGATAACERQRQRRGVGWVYPPLPPSPARPPPPGK